jgi:hypothetical protein
MEPITICGAVIVAVGLWEELEPFIMKVARVISNSSIMSAVTSSTPVQKPVYVKHMTGM